MSRDAGRVYGWSLWLLGACAGGPQAAKPPNAEPASSPGLQNAFAATERSSSDVNALLLSCVEDIQRTELGKTSAMHVTAWYCVCMTDALGILEQPLLTRDAAAPKCVDFARSTTPHTPGETQTPYGAHRFLNAGQIAGAFQGCVQKTVQDPYTSGLTSLQQEMFCSCLVDSMRARRSASTAIGEDLTRTCANAANWKW
ncbi:MAG: hypothetical protein JWN04_4428 [Myxococcaceae bacterium]|nr:hypothetical protein [Myxococcaceae bacterium]